MRMSKTHFKMLESAIAKVWDVVDRNQTIDRYRRRDFGLADKCTDVNKRYRWDVFWSADAIARRESATNTGLHTLLNDGDYDDAHINTALKRIVPDIV